MCLTLARPLEPVRSFARATRWCQCPGSAIEQISDVFGDASKNSCQEEACERREYDECYSGSYPGPDAHLPSVSTGDSWLLSRRSLEDSKAIDADTEALRLAVVPFYEDLQLVRVEDRSVQTYAHLGPEQLDPVTFIWDPARVVLIIVRPHTSWHRQVAGAA